MCRRDRPTWFGPGPHPAAHLRRQHDVVPPPRDRLADHRLRLAGRVDVGGVDEVDAGVERAVHDAVGAGLIEAADHFPDLPAAAEGHRAQAQLRDEHAGVGQWSNFIDVVYSLSNAPSQAAEADHRRPRPAVRDVPDHVRRSREHLDRRPTRSSASSGSRTPSSASCSRRSAIRTWCSRSSAAGSAIASARGGRCSCAAWSGRRRRSSPASRAA